MTDRPEGLLAQAEAEVKAMVKPCRSASCFGRYRVAGLEYDTGGCLTYDEALHIAREATAMGGADEWAKCYAIRLDGSPKWSRRSYA
jgi:hypothetical protein